MSNDAPRPSPISEPLHEELDRFRSEAYSRGAESVWRSLGVGEGMPNEAVWDDKTETYVIRPKAPSDTTQ